MRSNYRRVQGVGDWSDLADLFKSEEDVVRDEIAVAQNEAPGCNGVDVYDIASGRCVPCPPGTSVAVDFDRNIRSCVPNAPPVCPAGHQAQQGANGAWKCVFIQGSAGSASLSAGGGIADFFANLFNGGGSTAAPAVSTGGGTISPGTPVPKMVPGTSFVIPDKGAATSPVVVGTPASSNIPTALLVLGAVGLLGGAVYVATR